MRASNELRTRLAPLAQQVCFTFGEGADDPASCGGDIPFPPTIECFWLTYGCVCVARECEIVYGRANIR